MFNLHKKLLGEVPMTYNDPVSATILSTVVGGGLSLYQSGRQEDIAEEDQKKRDKAAAEAKAETERIARETRPEGETATGIEFGTGDRGGPTGSTEDFLVPKTSALGAATGSSGRSGLGFTV